MNVTKFNRYEPDEDGLIKHEIDLELVNELHFSISYIQYQLIIYDQNDMAIYEASDSIYGSFSPGESIYVSDVGYVIDVGTPTELDQVKLTALFRLFNSSPINMASLKIPKQNSEPVFQAAKIESFLLKDEAAIRMVRIESDDGNFDLHIEAFVSNQSDSYIEMFKVEAFLVDSKGITISSDSDSSSFPPKNGSIFRLSFSNLNESNIKEASINLTYSTFMQFELLRFDASHRRLKDTNNKKMLDEFFDSDMS